jgi:glycerophosphoryl diester phosphodiesterase
MFQPAIYAHRGASAQVKENTIAAFQRAIELGADGIELDVRCTIDRVLVIHHDAEIQGRAIDQLTWAELQAIQSRSPDGVIDAEIPTLDQVVRCCANQILLDVEIKESGYEAEVLQTLQPLALETFVITSFRLEVLDRIKQLNPKTTIGFLIDAETIDLLSDASLLNEKLNAIDIDFLAPNWQILNHPIVAQLSPQIFWVWTVNEAIVMQQLMEEAKTRFRNRQIAAIITDNPERFKVL